MKPYPLQLEISSPIALRARPDTGSSLVSYVAPTPQHPLRLDRGEGWVRCRAQICVVPTFSAMKGICIPCLDWKEFASDYAGPFQPETRVCETESQDLPTILRIVFDQIQSICAS